MKSMNRLSLPTGMKINKCFSAVYTVYTNTNDDEMSWKNEISATKRENTLQLNTLIFSTNENSSPAWRFSNY